MPALFHDQPVPADDDVLDIADRLDGPEHGDLDLAVVEFRPGHRGEPRIPSSRGDGTSGDDGRERLIPIKMPDAAAQVTVAVERDEHAGAEAEHALRFGPDRRPAGQRVRHRSARFLQQPAAIVRRESSWHSVYRHFHEAAANVPNTAAR